MPKHKLHLFALTILGMAILGCNILKPRTSESRDPTSYNDKELDEDISAYASMCRHEVGFDGIDIPPMNCLDGAEVPTLIDGKPPTTAQYEKLSRAEIGCDNPSWLFGVGCVNYNFVLTRKLNEDVHLALICRSRSFSSPDNLAARKKTYQDKQDLDSFKKLYYFDSLGMIVSNRKTGKTCFFDQVDPVYGGFIPYPDRRTSPTIDELPSPKPVDALMASDEIKSNVIAVTPYKTWKKPFQTSRGDRCTVCHDSGPWKHTPWLPSGIDVPNNDKTIPYIALGPAFEYWRTTFQPTAVNTADVTVQTSDGPKTEPQLCTSCHRIGREATCKDTINYATGHSEPALLSETGKLAHSRRWMPPQSPKAAAMNEADFIKDWDAKYKAHFDAMRRCCDNPKQDGCTQTGFGSIH